MAPRLRQEGSGGGMSEPNQIPAFMYISIGGVSVEVKGVDEKDKTLEGLHRILSEALDFVKTQLETTTTKAP